jgi:hypothetical protein
VSDKIYRLELTAEELEGLPGSCYINDKSVVAKLSALVEQARVDRERDDLRLPWEWVDVPSDAPSRYGYDRPGCAELKCPGCQGTLRMKRLVFASPELLEAVQAVKEYDLRNLHPSAVEYRKTVAPLIDRALRKVETGQAEEP